YVLYIFFFFSSRRRHTRSDRDWSSDVCSSDLQTSDSRIAVELSDAEQKMIGVQTVEVQRKTIRKEIAAPGKVAEPETGIGAVSRSEERRVGKECRSRWGRWY